MGSAHSDMKDQTVWVRYEWDLRAKLDGNAAPTGYRFCSALADEREIVTNIVITAYASDPVWNAMIEDIKRRMTDRIATTLGKPTTDYIVAERDGQIVAVSGIALSHWTQQNFLTGLCVIPSHQRKGLGKHLLYLSLVRLKEMGVQKATVYTERGSVADTRLYRQFDSVREEGVAYPALTLPPESVDKPDRVSRSITHNVYFEGKVQSLGFESATCRATIGVILPGAYTFSADFEEHVTLIEGTLRVRIRDRWLKVDRNETYVVPRGNSFEVRAEEQTAYVCYYR